MVALGTLVSATWILSVNSWMQTPVGYAISDKGQFVPAGSWLPIIFNPSFPFRLVHTVIAAYLTTSLVVGAVGAWHLLKDRTNIGARKMFSMAMWMAAVVAPIQVVAGDAHDLNTLEHQTAKVLAMEGHYEASPTGASLILFGMPDNKAGVTRFAVEVPKLGSLILRHDPNAPLQGLKDFPQAVWPPAVIVFWSFRIMVGLGLAMVGLGLWSLLARAFHRLYEAPWLHRAAVAMGPAGFVAVIAGWITTEVGRQPYTIYGLLLTSQSHSPLGAPAVAASLLSFVVVYFLAFGAGGYYLLRLMSKPPESGEPEVPATPQRAAGITPGPAIEASAPVDGERGR